MVSKLDYFVDKLHGKYIFSILLGLGLASIFRRACAERNCLTFKAPSLKEIKGNVYKFGNKCFKFNEKAVKCEGEKLVDF